MITPLIVALFPHMSHFQIFFAFRLNFVFSPRACREWKQQSLVALCKWFFLFFIQHTILFSSHIFCSTSASFSVACIAIYLSCVSFVSTALLSACVTFFLMKKREKQTQGRSREENGKKMKPNKIESNICVIWHLKKRSISDPFSMNKNLGTLFILSSFLFFTSSSSQLLVSLSCARTLSSQIIVIVVFFSSSLYCC